MLLTVFEWWQLQLYATHAIAARFSTAYVAGRSGRRKLRAHHLHRRTYYRHGESADWGGAPHTDVHASRSAAPERAGTDARSGAPRDRAHSEAHRGSESPDHGGHLGHAGGALGPVQRQG